MSRWPYLMGKRLLDVVVSALALVVATPVFVVVAVAIKLDDAGPVFFAQLRVGLRGRVFTMLKFRTMSVADARDAVLDTSTWSGGVPDDFVFKTPDSASDRITRVGRVLRRTSLDEVPQLINVLLGDMTLVGPRPEIVPIAERYSTAQAARLSVKPGITGWAQVTGRALYDHGQKMAADRYYVEHASMRLDVMILLRTFAVALRRHEAY